MVKPVLARGMRDFSPQEILQRNFLFDIIKKKFSAYGFLPLETPAIESLSVLTGKYGEEGDKLLFKIINSGDFLADVPDEDLKFRNSKKILPKISEKGLRYDLTVPLARYVVMNRNDITLPFKRYQIDKVWRADRPQKGRYREFFQCDGDIIGSTSKLYDAEIVFLIDDVLSTLGIDTFTIKINNRKILQGIAEELNFADRFSTFTIIIDKWDKIGEQNVVIELANAGFTETQIHRIQNLFRLTGNIHEKLEKLETLIGNSQTGKIGIDELKELFSFVADNHLLNAKVELDFKLARGLDYYTSTIFEVVTVELGLGSIVGGGRYDELTEAFGMKEMPGVGISFGAERIFDLMKSRNLFPKENAISNSLLLANFSGLEELYAFKILIDLRRQNISCEMYPTPAKLAKQFTYAEKKGISNILIIGEEERKSGLLTLKNISTGIQEKLKISEITERFGRQSF